MKLKLARVVPVFKSGNPSLLTNYKFIYVLWYLSFYMKMRCYMITILNSDLSIVPSKHSLYTFE